jgi:hypothetical protein
MARNPKMVTIEGVTKPLRDWAEEFGLRPVTLYNRIFRGYSGSSLLEPTRERMPNISITIDGVTRTLNEWSEITGVYRQTLYWRYKHGMRGKMLLKTE